MIVLVSVIVFTGLVTWGMARLAREVQTRKPLTGPLWSMMRRGRASVVATFGFSVLLLAEPAAGLPERSRGMIRHILVLLVIATCAWLIVHAVTLLVNTSFERYAANATDTRRVRRIETQIALIRRTAVAIVGIITFAAMIMTFPGMKTIGTSLLASAGLLGVVAGLAAQSALANLFAGLQIAFSDMVRIGDSVVVNQEMGTIEEITLTYLVVNTWDQRRIVMPVSYFTSRPFENWSRTDTRMTGTVFLHLDHSAPVGELRDELHRILKDTGLWDGQGWSLYVTDTTPTTILVRAVVTARDSDDLWTLRCEVREKLLDYLRCEHPYALPRIATAPAPLGNEAVGPYSGNGRFAKARPQPQIPAQPAGPRRYVDLAKKPQPGSEAAAAAASISLRKSEAIAQARSAASRS
nr:mechanosensitive ion channel family protein [Streptomyces sp. SID3343]